MLRCKSCGLRNSKVPALWLYLLTGFWRDVSLSWDSWLGPQGGEFPVGWTVSWFTRSCAEKAVLRDHQARGSYAVLKWSAEMQGMLVWANKTLHGHSGQTSAVLPVTDLLLAEQTPLVCSSVAQAEHPQQSVPGELRAAWVFRGGLFYLTRNSWVLWFV